MKTRANTSDFAINGRFISKFCLFWLILFGLTSSPIQAQKDSTGFILITLKDSASLETIPFAKVIVYLKDKQLASGTTNIDGKRTFKVAAGIYNVKAVAQGYKSMQVNTIKVPYGRIAYVTVTLSSASVHLEEVQVVTYQVPLIDPDMKSGTTITRDDYNNIAPRDLNNVSTTNIWGTPSRGARAAQRNKSEERDYYPYQGERYQGSAENTFKTCKKDPLSTFSSDVDVASYANIRRMLNQGNIPPKESVRIEEMINYFRYAYPAPAEKDVFAIHNEVSSCPWNKGHRLLQVGIQGKTVELNSAAPNHLTFLIDVSGSMDDENKLPLLKKALSMLVQQMRPIDRIALVVYAGQAGLVLPSTSGEQKEENLNAIGGLGAGGSTAGGEGIMLAYSVAKENFSKKANNRVILATDGDFNVGMSSDEALVDLIEEKRETGIFLTVLGFGTGNYQDAMMEKLADKGNGNYAYIDNLLEAKKVLVKEMGGTLVTIAKDVKIQIEFNPALVKSYRLIGYDNRMLAHEDFKDDKKDAGDVGSGHSVTALYEIIPAESKEGDGAVDEYKYQQNSLSAAASSKEICTVKLRYKMPEGKTSKEISSVVSDKDVPFEQTSDNFRFCSAVAGFGLILRQSEHKGEAKYSDMIRIAKAAKGEDANGYRAEFIRLCELADGIASK